MIFFDASSAAKRYFEEAGSGEVARLWSGQKLFFSLPILHCELTSVLNRKRRERALPRGAYSILKKQIADDLKKIHTTPINAELIELSLRILDAYPLKTLDALYLAGAVSLQKALKESVVFVAADRQILHAAQAEGLRTLNPEA